MGKTSERGNVMRVGTGSSSSSSYQERERERERETEQGFQSSCAYRYVLYRCVQLPESSTARLDARAARATEYHIHTRGPA